jgi:hypothetical protein
MATQNLDSADLKAVELGGVIREDVLNKIFDISKIPLPFTDMIGKGSHKNSYCEWVEDALAAPDVTNAVIDGSDAAGNDTRNGRRLGNHSQISTKVVRVSHRADASDTIGRAKELGYQLSRRGNELRRDVEAIVLENQGSVPDNGNDTAGLTGGLPTFLETTAINGTAGGFNAGTGTTDAWTTTGAPIAISETNIRDAVQSIYQEGGNPTKLMSVPSVIRIISEYMFTSSARVATLLSDQGKTREKAAAMGSVNVFISDFGSLEFIPNRLQQTQTAGATGDSAFVFILDPEYLSLSYLEGYRAEPLAKTGLANNRQLSVDYALKVHSEKSCGLIGDVSTTAPMIP